MRLDQNVVNLVKQANLLLNQCKFFLKIISFEDAK